LSETNTLAYYKNSSITNVKCFITLGPVGDRLVLPLRVPVPESLAQQLLGGVPDEEVFLVDVVGAQPHPRVGVLYLWLKIKIARFIQ
jgi:hypothetical protein